MEKVDHMCEVVAVFGDSGNSHWNMSFNWGSGTEKIVEFDACFGHDTEFYKNYCRYVKESRNSGADFTSIALLHGLNGDHESIKVKDNFPEGVEDFPRKFDQALEEMMKFGGCLTSESIQREYRGVEISTVVDQTIGFDYVACRCPNIAGMVKAVEAVVGVADGKPATAVAPLPQDDLRKIQIFMKKGEGIVVVCHGILLKKITDFKAKLDEIVPILRGIYNENYDLLKSQNGVLPEFWFWVKLQLIENSDNKRDSS